MRRVPSLGLTLALALGLGVLPLRTPIAAPLPARDAARLVPDPAYFRPVVDGGMAFPVSRSNFFSVLSFGNDWHAVRLRLIGGKWLPVGVHEGIDILAEKGTPVVATIDGTIENVGWTFYSGTRVGLRGTDGRYYFYAHLSEVEPGIVPGAGVAVGSVLGRVGNTGYGSPGTQDQFPPHLHFGIQDPSGGWVSPYPDLVRLYRVAVRAGRHGEAKLERLAEADRRADWRAEAEGLYTRFGIPLP